GGCASCQGRVEAGRVAAGLLYGGPPPDAGSSTAMNILGINCFSHDTAAALLQDGEPVAFVEEERFNREKHTRAFPDKAVEFCLREAGIGIRDVHVVAFAHRAGLDLRRGMADLLRRLPRSAR